MTPRQAAANAFVNLWRYLSDVFGQAIALADRSLQAARREYLETAACPTHA